MVPLGVILAYCCWHSDIRNSRTLKIYDASGRGNEIRHQSSYGSEDNIYRQHPERLIEDSNVAIEFWGRSVDENDHPVAEVVVKYSTAEAGHLDWKSHESKGQTISDKDGSLHIKAGRGWVFSIDAVEKTGYKYIKGISEYIYTGNNELFIPDKNMPQKLVLVEEKNVQALSHYYKNLPLSWDGKLVHVNLTTGNLDPDGDMQITVSRELIEKPRLYTWSCRIEIKNGGIQLKKDFAPNIAPVDGYRDSIEKSVESKLFGDMPVFWVKTSQGRFACLELFLNRLDQPDNELSSIQAWLNPEPGNRILEDKSFQP